MPISPFHFGPGALFKCVGPAHVSWTVFALANVLIDLEPIALFFLTGDPAHPWLHTLLGAIIVATVAATAGRWPCEWFLRWWNRQLSPVQAQWLAAPTKIGSASAWVGALVGTISHILLDAVMHSDVRPFWPLVQGNPLQGLIAVQSELWGPQGSAVLRLALDTGATSTVVNVAMLVAIGYDPALSSDRVQVTTGSGIEFAPRVILQRIIALGHERFSFPVLGHTLPPSAGVDGLLGLDFFRGLNLAMDFRTGQVTLA